jgi:hypothetical protein
MSHYLSFVFVAGYFTLMPSLAHAYIDPGSGSMFLQLAIAAIAGGLFTLKIYWQRLKNFLGLGQKPSEVDPLKPDDKS